MNWLAIVVILVGLAIGARSVEVERRKGGGRAGNVLLAGGSITFVGLVWLFWF